MAFQFLVAIVTIISFVPNGAPVPLLSDLLQRDATSRAMPVQMDMASDEDITICTGQIKNINCRDGANMAVTNTFWGRISDKVCPSDDADPVTDCNGSKETLGLIRSRCEGKKNCRLAAKHVELQHNGTSHCPGVNKYLIVNYTCIPESQGVTLCNSVETELKCAADWTMELADVFWGRRANAKICGPDDSYECDASDYAGRYLKNKCNGKKKCLIKADSSVLDSKSHSTCSGIPKYLMVNYICKPTFKTQESSSADESEDDKDLKETSSKELMGLIEKHISSAKSSTRQIDLTKKTSNANVLPLGGIQQSIPVVQPKKQVLVVGKTGKFAASEDYDAEPISSVYKNIKKDETPNIKKDETPNIKSSIIKNEETLAEESKASDKKESSEVAKDTVTIKKEPEPKTTQEESYELSEPNTVRSILDRAKEVLKTLDGDSTSIENSIDKRGGIATHQDQKVIANSKFVNDTARAVKQVAQLAQTLVRHAEAKSILKNKTSNLLKKSTVVQKPADSAVTQVKIIQENAMGQKPAAVKSNISQVPEKKDEAKPIPENKRSFVQQLRPHQFGNTP